MRPTDLIPLILMTGIALLWRVIVARSRRGQRTLTAPEPGRGGQRVKASAPPSSATPPGAPPTRIIPVPGVLTEADWRYLNRVITHASTLSTMHHEIGQRLADRLRCLVGLPDTDMAKVAIQILFIAAESRTDAAKEGIPADEMHKSVLDVIACAVLDLTMIERSTTSR